MNQQDSFEKIKEAILHVRLRTEAKSPTVHNATAGESTSSSPSAIVFSSTDQVPE